MLNKIDNRHLAAALFAASFGILTVSRLAGLHEQSAPLMSTGLISALVAVLGVIALVNRLEWISGGAMATGAWSLMAPIMLGFFETPAFWIHLFAGIMVMGVAILSAELSNGPPHSTA